MVDSFLIVKFFSAPFVWQPSAVSGVRSEAISVFSYSSHVLESLKCDKSWEMIKIKIN